jgi:hypothetical protein
VSKIETLLTRYDYKQDSEPAEDGVRYWHSSTYTLPISIIDSIWECTDGSKVFRGTGSRPALRRLELAILRTVK